MPPVQFTPFPNLSTSRLDLRRVRMADEGEIFILRSDERMVRYVDIPRAKDLEDARAYIRKIDKGIEDNEWINWGLYVKGTRKLMGTICLWNIRPDGTKAETGYMLLPEFHGSGFMQEAMGKVLDYGFNTMGLQIIEAYTHFANEGSINLLKKFHFEKCEHEEGDETGNYVIFAVKNPVTA